MRDRGPGRVHAAGAAAAGAVGIAGVGLLVHAGALPYGSSLAALPTAACLAAVVGALARPRPRGYVPSAATGSAWAAGAVAAGFVLFYLVQPVFWPDMLDGMLVHRPPRGWHSDFIDLYCVGDMPCGTRLRLVMTPVVTLMAAALGAIAGAATAAVGSRRSVAT